MPTQQPINFYPHTAGHRGVDTSVAAASAIERSGRAGDYRSMVLAIYRRGGEFTADEIATLMNADILTIRPRVTELVKQELLEDTGIRRRSSRGKASRVYRIKPKPLQGESYDNAPGKARHFPSHRIKGEAE